MFSRQSASQQGNMDSYFLFVLFSVFLSVYTPACQAKENTLPHKVYFSGEDWFFLESRLVIRCAR